MWIKRSDRRRFTDTFLGNNSEITIDYHASDFFPVDLIPENDLYLIWELEPKNKRILPNIIVVADGHLRDFLAWAITYFPIYRPFTAYCRVLEFGELTSLRNWFESPSLDTLETACVGLIICEAHLLSAASENPAQMAAISCSKTISYVLSRALALGANENQINIVCEKWTLARKLTEQPVCRLDMKHIKCIYKMLTKLRSGGRLDQPLNSDTGIPTLVVKACSQLKCEGKISDKTWDELTTGIEELKAAQQQMESTREDRVRYFQRIISNQSISKLTGDVMQAFICGYLASLIEPGSLSHIDLVSRYTSQLPNALLWYGLCAGFHRKNKLLTSFNILGRRLLRELIRYEPLLRPPFADIAISELQILLERKEKLFDFRTFISKRVVAELIPCVSTHLVWPKREGKQMGLFSKSDEFFNRTELLSDLESHLKDALKTYRLIVEQGNQNRHSKSKPKGIKKKKSRREK